MIGYCMACETYYFDLASFEEHQRCEMPVIARHPRRGMRPAEAEVPTVAWSPYLIRNWTD